MVKWIRPPRIPTGQIDQQLRMALRQAGSVVQVEYKLFTGTWEQKNEPQWKQLGPRKEGNDLVWRYGTSSVPFMYVEEGTRPHIIRARIARMLRFQTGFIAKTKPGQIASGVGARFGPFARAKQVMHPGNAPRHISETIATGILPRLLQYIQDAIKW